MEDQTFKFLNKIFILATVLVLGVLVFFVGQIVLQNKSIDIQNQNQITVSGYGKIYAKPDVASIALGARTTGLTVANVTEKNTEIMNTIIGAVKKLGIEEKAVND